MAGGSGARDGHGVAVALRDVDRVFEGGVAALDAVSFEVAPSEFVAILGPSGCGKSTLLRLIAGLDRPQRGAVARTPGDSHVACVFQDAHLLPWRRVLANVALPLELAGVPLAEREREAREAVGRVGLADAADRYPAQLSGGMRMRVSLARALVTRPALLLLDEPFAALDELTRQRLDEDLHALWRRDAMTVVFVTHSVDEAAFLAQRAIVLTRRPARVASAVPLDLPAERRAELRGDPGFFAAVRDLRARLEQAEA